MKYFMVVLFIVLTGCKGIPLTSLPELYRAEPLRDDPQTYSIAFEHTRGVHTRKGSESFYINILDLASGKVLETGKYRGVQKELLETDGIKGLTFDADKRTLIYTLDHRDVASLKAMQARLLKLKHQGKQRKARGDKPTRRVDVGANFKSCKMFNTLPKDMKATIYVKIRRGGPFVPIYRNIPLKPYLDTQHKGPLLLC